MQPRAIQMRSLGFVTKGGRLSKRPDEPAFEEPTNDGEHSEPFTSSANTAFSPFVKKEEDAGITPISSFQFNFSNNQQIPIKTEDDYGEGQFADCGEVEEADEEDCQCYDCLIKEVALIDKEEYEESRRNREKNSDENMTYKNFIEELHRNNFVTTIHRQRHTSVKPVYECTYNNCGLTFSSMNTIFYHLRKRHLNLGATLNQQKKQNRLETLLPPNRRPAAYVKQTNRNLTGYLLEDEETEKSFEELFNLADHYVNYKEREELVYTSRTCESVVIAWFQRRRDRERYKEKPRSGERLTNVDNQISTQSATATTQILKPSSSPPSTSSHTNGSAHHISRMVQIDFFKRMPKYNEEKAKEIIKGKLRTKDAVKLNLTPPANFLTAFGFEIKNFYVPPELANVTSNRLLARLKNSKVNNQAKTISGDQNSNGSTHSSDSDFGSGRTQQFPKKSSIARNDSINLQRIRCENVVKTQKTKSTTPEPNNSLKTSATFNSTLSAKSGSPQIRKELTLQNYKISKISTNKSNHPVQQLKPPTATNSTSGSTRKRVLPNLSSKVQSSTLDTAKLKAAGRVVSRQSSITGPLHDFETQQEWGRKYKIPKISQTNRQSTEDSSLVVSQ